MKHAYQMLVSFQAMSAFSASDMLAEIHVFVEAIEQLSPKLNSSEWMLTGDTVEDASRYGVFEDRRPTVAALAVLERELKGVVDPRMISIWNGGDGDEGASILYMGRPSPNVCLLTFNTRPKSFTDDWKAIVAATSKAAVLWRPTYITLHSNGYWPHQTFKDRPGVGWMIYLDKIINVRQVPDARALVPVRDGKQQIGTIVVSEIDESFSDENPQHVKVANEIEIRLVDLDLLPALKTL